MRIGIGLPSFASHPHAIPPDRFRQYARMADEYGFAGSWLIEHLRRNPNYDSSTLDPLTTLSLVAGETETIPVGTSVLLLPLRNPILLAKRVATLQHLSSRQVTLGMGAGYVEAEFEAVGVPHNERSDRYLEGIELVYRLLHEDTVSFDGEFYSVGDLRLEPATRQPPRILAGGGGVDTDTGRRIYRTVKRRMRYANGWIAAPNPPEISGKDWERFSRYLGEQDEDPNEYDTVQLQYVHLVPDNDSDRACCKQRKVYGGIVGADRSVDDAAEMWLTGTPDEIVSTLKEYQQIGFDEVILQPLTRTPSDLQDQLELYNRRILPEFA